MLIHQPQSVQGGGGVGDRRTHIRQNATGENDENFSSTKKNANSFALNKKDIQQFGKNEKQFLILSFLCQKKILKLNIDN